MAIKNAVIDGNFETGGTWISVPPAEIVSDGNAMNSSRCLRFINQATGGLQRTFQMVNVVRGARYELYFWAKRTGRMDVWAAYSYQDANGVSQTVHAPSMLNTVTGSYTRQFWSFTVPSNASSSTIGLLILSGGNAGDTATAWIDNVELWGEEYIAPLPDPGPHPAGYNHLTNGTFETADAWQFVTPASIVTDSANAKEGTRCLKLPYRSTAGMQYAYQSVNLVPSKEYILSFFAKRSGRLDVWAGYSYTDTNGVNQRVHGPSLLSQMPDNGGYRRQEYRFTVPSTASSNYSVYIHGGNNPSDVGVSAYVDDVVLVRADGSGSSGSGSSGDSIGYNRDAAVAYAKQFAQNNNNFGFHSFGNDCANFVSQCLFAGGLPMDNTWYYHDPYGPTHYASNAWPLTAQTRNSLVSRLFAAPCSKSDLKRGDIVYTIFLEDVGKAPNTISNLDHVVIVSRDVGSDGSVYVCGHTSPQNDVQRDSDIPSIYYHISDVITLKDGDECFVGYSDADDFASAMSDFGTSTLRQNDSSMYVGNAKKRLKYLGYYTGTVDNVYDAALVTAVSAFKSAKGISPQDGTTIGETTKIHLYRPK